MISVKEAINFVVNNTNATTAIKEKSLQECLGFTLAKDVLSAINMPPFRQSSMDGYAIHIHDENTYKLVGEVQAGSSNHPTLQKGEAVRIFTGAPVPDTANCVIIQENVQVENKIIRYDKKTILNDNIRSIGDQTHKGAIALKKGTKLNAAAIGYLTTLGVTMVNVYAKPQVAILITGDELVEAGKELSYGKVYESNAAMLKNALLSIGYQATVHQVKDNYEATRNTLAAIIENNDLVFISGGISVGDYDFVGKALKELAVNQIFYKVKQKPGKPLFFGKKDDTTIFALPGNPASALCCFYIYGHLALERISGNTTFKHQKMKLSCDTDFIKKGTRAQFLKADTQGNSVRILEGQNSATLHTYAVSNALVFLEEETMQVTKGEIVTLYKLPII